MPAIWVKLAVQEFDVGHQARDVRRQIGPHHAVADTPTGHGIGLGESIQQDGALLKSRVPTGWNNARPSKIRRL